MASETDLEPRTRRDLYDSLRAAADDWLAQRVGPRYAPYRKLLFLLPDVLTLAVRLARDPRAGLVTRLQLWGLILYVLSPVDISLDLLFPVGAVDDLALALIVLNSVLARTPPALLRELWPGEEDALDELAELARSFAALRGLLRSRRRWRAGT